MKRACTKLCKNAKKSFTLKKSKNTVRFRIIYLIRIGQKNLSNINGCKKNQEKLKLLPVNV